jgi:polyhydroxyalkanoate synthesis regulator phasin
LPKEGFYVITIHSQACDKARSVYEEMVKSGKIKNKSFSRYVNDLILETIEADEALSLAAPHIEKSALIGNSVLLKDNKLGRMIEVQIQAKERNLFCTYDKRNDCVHVGFSYAIPQVYAVMKKIKKR